MKWFFSLFLCCSAWASFSDFYGTSAGTIGLAGSVSFESYNPENLYLAPALSGHQKNTTANFSIFYDETNFTPINGITTKNTLVLGSDESGNIQVNGKPQVSLGVGFIFPLFKSNNYKLGINLITPADKVLALNSGHPFTPEYVLYRDRTKRLQTTFDLARSYESTSFSLGIYSSFKSSSRLDTRQSMNGSDNGSSGQLRAEIKPAMALRVSIAHQWPSKWMTYLTFQDEMKGRFRADVVGETTTPNLPYDITITSLMNYDPRILRLGVQKTGDIFSYSVGLEHEWWKNFETPILKIQKNSGSLQSSDDYEMLRLKNIFVTKLAAQWKLSSSWTQSIGITYRPSIFAHDFSGPGNSLDQSKYIFATGLGISSTILGQSLKFNLGAQYHHLPSQKITKTAGREDGSAGQKVGSPGYEIGGRIIVLGLTTSLYY